MPSDCDTAVQQRGLFKATRSRNGTHPDRVPSCGSTGNVSSRLAHTLLQKLIDFSFRSGRGEECTLVGQPFDIFILRTYGVGQFYNHRGDRDYVQIWARIARHVFL
jgi:hypothetical protein